MENGNYVYQQNKECEEIFMALLSSTVYDVKSVYLDNNCQVHSFKWGDDNEIDHSVEENECAVLVPRLCVVPSNDVCSVDDILRIMPARFDFEAESRVLNNGDKLALKCSQRYGPSAFTDVGAHPFYRLLFETKKNQQN